MTRRLIVLFWFVLLAAGSTVAQAPPPEAEPQSGRVFCDQSVSYRLADPSTIPESYRRFLGAWTDAAWDANTCAGLIVDDVKSDGTAVIRDYELRFQSSDGSQYTIRPAIADLVGQMITPKGQTYQAAFKKTF